MPLTPGESYSRRDELQLAILYFLRTNDFAYTAEEIAFELAAYGHHESDERVQAGLDRLVRDQLLDQTQRGGSHTTNTIGG